MKCNKCGFEFTEGIFCPECGTKNDLNEFTDKIIIDNNRYQEEFPKEKRELNLEKTKVDQGKFLVERAVHEAELAHQQDEEARIEQEKCIGMEEQDIEKKTKKANSLAIWSFVLSIATYPLVMTLVLWFPSIILSIVFGVMAIKEKTTKKGLTIAGLIVNGMFILICFLGLIL